MVEAILGGHLLDTGHLLEGVSNTDFLPQGGSLLDTRRLIESGHLLDHLWSYLARDGERKEQSLL